MERAINLGLGARGLRTICEAVMTDAMFELPSEKNVKEFVVTREYAEQRFEGLEPQLLKVA